jgi:hypothetical protein
LALLGSVVLAAEAPSPTADRAAIERVYHSHRTGTKQPFEQAMPRELLEKLVRQDQHKEAVLKRVYKVEVTPAMVAAEVQRIDTTTRAPEVLAEIKRALGDDATRFARSMARPIIVERELRQRFDNDDTLHAAKRAEADQARTELLAGKSLKEMHEATWQLTPRPDGEKAGNQRPEATGPPPQTKGVAKSGNYTVEATAQLSQALTSPEPAAPGKEKVYFEDLDPELQKVLRVQLQKPGDVSAVIETPGGFLVFRAREKSSQTLSVASLSIPKRSYEEWLAQQPDTKP